MTDRRINRILGVLLIIMALITTGQTAWYSWEQQKCNEAFVQGQVRLRKLAQQDRAAVYNLLHTIWSAPRDDQVEIQAFKHYFETYRRTTQARKHIDALPNNVCD